MSENEFKNGVLDILTNLVYAVDDLSSRILSLEDSGWKTETNHISKAIWELESKIQDE